MQTIEFKRPDGQAVKGVLAQAAQPLAALVVIQEWWGVNEQIRGVAQRFADAGFTALVPDLYRGKSTVEAEEAHHLMSGLNFGVTGYCMGGALTVLASTMVPEMDAGVIWYGLPPLEYVDASKITAPLQAHWATQDQAFAIANVDGLEAKFRDAKLRYEGHRYLAHHAFANETAQGRGRIPITQYDAVWAQMAWDRSMRFFGSTLA